MYPNPEVREIVEALVSGVGGVLGADLMGIYLRGSLVTGDFNPETSDVDLLIVVGQNLNQADFERLDAMHRRIQTLPALALNRYANEVELAYVPVSDINGFEPGEWYISLERGEGLRWKQLRHNWVVEFWAVREHGVTLLGPEPKTFIEPIPMERVVGAIRLELGNWLLWVDSWDSPGWQNNPENHAGEMRFAVETMCRVLYTLTHLGLCSKKVAACWALDNLPEPWSLLIQESQSWQAGGAVSPNTTRQIADFIRWVAHKA